MVEPGRTHNDFSYGLLVAWGFVLVGVVVLIIFILSGGTF